MLSAIARRRGPSTVPVSIRVSSPETGDEAAAAGNMVHTYTYSAAAASLFAVSIVHRS